jgi:2-polyprenyl-3-methyl-5-hydroxy-6-metoxy-1,4-benzoquinol methylase
MKKALKQIIHKAGGWYIGQVCSSEYQGQSFSNHNERPIEYSFALQTLGAKRPKTVLDVGTGTTAWPHLLRNCGYVVTAIDNVRDYWPKGMVNRHWTVLNVDITNRPTMKLTQKYQAITCISVLEHIVDHTRAIQNMANLLEPGGILILTTPFSYRNPHPNVYTRSDALYGKDAPYICRSSSASELEGWLACGLTLERRELWQLFTGPVWATGERCNWRQAVNEDEPHQLGCFLFRRDE